MAQSGQVITNPNGEQLRFVQTAADTNGEMLEMEVTYIPHSDKPPEHYHPYQEETFHVLAGEFVVSVDGERRTYHAGDSFVVPARARHWMQNVSDEVGTLNWQVRPALDTESFFETMWTLANASEEYYDDEYDDEEYDEEGDYDDEEYEDYEEDEDYDEEEASKLDLLQLSLTLREFNREFRLSKPSYAMQRIVFGLLAPIARMRGYQARYSAGSLSDADPG